MKISVVNLSQLKTAEIHSVIRAVNRQIEQDFAPYWHTYGQLRLDDAVGPMGGAVQSHASLRGDAILYLVDTPQPQALLGYHEQHNLGIPYGAVHVEEARALENSPLGWSVTLSHEALELLADPHVNLLCRGPHPDPKENGRVVFHWLEMCDAVQSESYEIDGIRVSNFVLPSYFSSVENPSVRNDFLVSSGTPLQRFGVRPGGYVGFFDPQSNADVHYLMPSDSEATRRAALRGIAEGTRRRDRRAGPSAPTQGVGSTTPSPMSPQLQRLYTLIGDPPVPVVPAGPVHAMVSGEAARAAAAPSVQLAGESLLPKDVPRLRALLQESPDGVTEFLSIVRRRPVSIEEAHGILDSIARDLARPDERVTHMELLGTRAKVAPPADFTFEMYAAKASEPQIDIDTADTRFETAADAWRYMVRGGLNAALYHAGKLDVGPLRSHHDAAGEFVYLLEHEPEKDLPVALFADFANGYYHARHIARRMARKEYRYAVHLGDVYYAGSEAEVDDYLREPMKQVLEAKTELFMIEGNHEMYAKGRPWLAYLDEIRTKYPERQRQEGTYFRLKRNGVGPNPGFQIIAADTAWYRHARYERPELRSWLLDALTIGRDEGRMNILVTSNEPYEYGKTATTKLYDDLQWLDRDRLVDLWFWGNTHYCALFEPGPFSFVGSCIGHGGYPYARQFKGEPSAAPVHWLEDGGRFGREDIRPDRGNNGFCELTLKTDGSAALEYIDWMGNRRHKAVVTVGRDGPRVA